jgi:hypothetical protein
MLQLSTGEVGMAITRSEQSLELIRTAYETAEDELVLTSFQIRRSQKALIEQLAKSNSESQATVLRAIIDEWCECKLRE